MLSQNELKKILHYDENTGEFTSKISKGKWKEGRTVGYKDKHGYINIRVDKITYKAHRLAFLYMTGVLPKTTVFHNNKKRDDNTFSNLSLTNLDALEFEKEIINEYRPGIDSLRDVAERLNTNHKLVGRVLKKHNIEIIKAPRKPFSSVHRKRIGESSKGRNAWNKNRVMPLESKYQNMANHLRFDIDYKWLLQFDLEKLKMLNKALARERDMPNIDLTFYKSFINKFYYDDRFNKIFEKYISSGYQKLFRPSLDHIVPKSRGGSNSLENLQYLTWFENLCKRDMKQDEWEEVKKDIFTYFID